MRVKELDPAWPVLDKVEDVTPVHSAGNKNATQLSTIHINPKFIKKVFPLSTKIIHYFDFAPCIARLLQNVHGILLLYFIVLANDLVANTMKYLVLNHHPTSLNAKQRKKDIYSP